MQIMRMLGLLAVLFLGLGGGYYFLQPSTAGSGPTPPQQQIDVVAIRQKLQSIGQAERQYRVTNGTYATLEQLSQADLLPGGSELRGYTFSATTATNDRFTITATVSDATKAGWPTLEISETMQVTQR
jgi:hypothetical protein